MWTSGDVGFEVAMNEGNNAICCWEWVDSGGVGRGLIGVISDVIEGEGEGGSWTLVVERALPFDLLISLTHRHAEPMEEAEDGPVRGRVGKAGS
jgi:hypothetical protein